MSKKYDYDAIIIGAGISGLVCGCYLAKAGMKTLIVEKSAKPGGCCTSFKRGGFHFDACVHSLGSLRPGGNARIIFEELELESRLPIRRFDPSDVIITPDHELHFWNDLDKTVTEFQDAFPGEALNIRKFFDFIDQCEGVSLYSLRSMTFENLLNRYFSGDDNLKALLSFPLLGNAGLPAKRISAIIGVLIYKEFMLDGGYYPDDSIQSFPDVLIERFKEFGGEIHLSCPVNKILLNDKKAEGVLTAKKGSFSSKYVISNADVSQTYLAMVGEEVLDDNVLGLLDTMEPSLSAFILYLGTDGKLENRYMDSTVWYLPHYDMDKVYGLTVDGRIDDLDWFLTRIASDKNSIFMFVNVPYINEGYWVENKGKLIDRYIDKMERVLPDLSLHVIFKDAATPKTLNKWTSNHKGAAYGWARTKSQFAVTGFTQTTKIRDLYLTGHWTTLFQGVAGVAYLGRDTSMKILKKENIS